MRPFIAPGNSSIMMRKGDVLVTISLQTAGVSAESAKRFGADCGSVGI